MIKPIIKILLFSSVFFSLHYSSVFAASLNIPEQNQFFIPDFLKHPFKKKILPAIESLDSDISTNSEKFVVKKIKLKGNTVLPKSLLLPIIQSVLNNRVSAEELNTLRQNITLLYRKMGYPTSYVILPNQNYDGGRVVLVAIEGSLGKIEVLGNERLKSSYFEDAIMSQIRKPLNSIQLEQVLESIRNESSLTFIRAKLESTDKLGVSDLKIRVKETAMNQWRLGANNYRSPLSGSERAFLTYQNTNIFSLPNNLSMQMGLTEGATDYSAKIFIPFIQWHLGFTGYIVRSDSRLIGEEFRSLNPSSITDIRGVIWQYRKFKPKNNRLLLSAGLEQLENKNNILSNSEESVLIFNAESKGSLLGVTHKWSSGIRKGLNASGSALSQVSNPSDFLLLSFNSYSYAPLIKNRHYLQIKTSFQYTNQSLIGLEKFSVGGIGTVRAYRENTLVRDNGLSIQSEYLYRWNDKLITSGFLDIGSAWNSGNNSQQKSLISIGVGVNWHPVKNLESEFYLGLPLINRAKGNGNLQDSGFHFNLSYRF